MSKLLPASVNQVLHNWICMVRTSVVKVDSQLMSPVPQVPSPDLDGSADTLKDLQEDISCDCSLVYKCAVHKTLSVKKSNKHEFLHCPFPPDDLWTRLTALHPLHVVNVSFGIVQMTPRFITSHHCRQKTMFTLHSGQKVAAKLDARLMLGGGQNMWDKLGSNFTPVQV